MARFRSVLSAAPTAATSACGDRVRWLSHWRGRIVVPSDVKLGLIGVFDISAVLRSLGAIAGSTRQSRSCRRRRRWGTSRDGCPDGAGLGGRQSGGRSAGASAGGAQGGGRGDIFHQRHRDRAGGPTTAAALFACALFATLLFGSRGCDVACVHVGGACGRGMWAGHTPPVRWLCAVLWYDTNKMRCLKRL